MIVALCMLIGVEFVGDVQFWDYEYDVQRFLVDVSCGFDACFECKVLVVGVPPLEFGGCVFESRCDSSCKHCWSLGFGLLVGIAPLAAVCIAPCGGDLVCLWHRSSGRMPSRVELPIPSDQRRS